MKKRITAIILALLVLTATALTAVAAGGVELPMVPIGGLKIPTMAIELKSNADSVVKSGEIVTFTTNFTSLDDDTALTRAWLEYTYSEGLIFKNDVNIPGIPQGWEIGTVSNADNKLSVNIFCVSPEDAVMDLSLKFSFEVAKVSGAQQNVMVTDFQLYDSESTSISNVSKAGTVVSFKTEAAVPEMKNIGASLRINNTPALRFGMTVAKDDSFYKAFPVEFAYSENADLKFGMLVIEKDKLTGELFANTSGAEVYMFEEVFSSTANELLFVYTIDGVTDYTKEYVFRPFAMHRESAGGEYQYYYAESKSRSARMIAEMELEHEESTKKIEYLNKFVK